MKVTYQIHVYIESFLQFMTSEQVCEAHSFTRHILSLLDHILLVCFITKSFLTNSFFHLHLLYQPHLGLCQATCIQSHQRQPRSAVAIATCEVQVSVADSQTVPTVATGVSRRLCCRLTLTVHTSAMSLSPITYSMCVCVSVCDERKGEWHLVVR